jgi:methylisocitrate lyase
MSVGPARLRNILTDTGFVAIPGTYDGLTARIIESIGFSAIYLGGNAMGLRLGAGQPFVTLTETVESLRQVTANVTLPVIVDIGAGFGSEAHVNRAVRELERAGASAVQIDDQPYPKRASYHAGRGGLAPAEHVVTKISAAVEARQNPDVMIFARTDALRVTKSVEEVVRRCKAYVIAGADVLMILDLMPHQMREIRAQLPNRPVAWFVSPALAAPSLEEMESAGFKCAIYPFNTVAAIADAVTRLWRSVAETGKVNQPTAQVAELRDSLQELIGMKTYWDIEKRAEMMLAKPEERK